MSTQNDQDLIYSQINSAAARPSKAKTRIIEQTILSINGHVLGFILGFIGALIIFLATNWLVLKGGDVVGPHLGLLGQFFIGYSVTFIGSIVGAVYFFVLGYLGGLLIGWIYNAVTFLRTPKNDS